MKARKYIHKIEVWQKTALDDGHGGLLQGDAKLGESWANVKSIPIDKLTSYGLDTDKNGVRIGLRYREDIDYTAQSVYFRYKNKEWFPLSVTDTDLEGIEITILAFD